MRDAVCISFQYDTTLALQSTPARGCSSVDRVLASEAKGRGFDPRQPRQLFGFNLGIPNHLCPSGCFRLNQHCKLLRRAATYFIALADDFFS